MCYRPKIAIASTISAQNKVQLGGTIVVHQLYKAVAVHCDVELVYIAPAGQRAGRYQVAPGLTEIVVPRTRKHADEEARLCKQLDVATAYDLALMTRPDLTPAISLELEKAIKKADCVVVDRFYLHNSVMQLNMGKRLLHRSHNVESLYKKSLFPDTKAAEEMLSHVAEREALCCAESAHTFACTAEDMNLYHEMYETPLSKLGVLLNGVNCEDNRFVSIEKRKKIKERLGLANERIGIFIGGSHLPNVRACEEIIELAYNCQDIKFFFIGPVCSQFSGRKLPKNLGLLGRVSEETRKFIFSVADFALNPMRTGSGSNVKMVDYMAAGLPVISTVFGARGIQDPETYLQCESMEDMIELVNRFDLKGYDRMTRCAREMVEDLFDWKVLAKILLEEIT